MIFDSISNIDRYRQFPDIYSVLLFLQEQDESDLRILKKQVIGENSTASFVKTRTKKMDDCIFEAHRKFIDIHYTIKGVEGIGVRYTQELDEKGSFNNDKDIGFYIGDHHSLTFIHPGEFLICFPEDAHKVAIMDKETCELEKIIVKIKY